MQIWDADGADETDGRGFFIGSETHRFQDLQHRIVPTGAIWAVIPKKKYARKWGIDFTWEELQAAGLQTDLVDNKVASIDEETYGTRFVIRAEYRDKYRD